ncbi:hypothetical protein [Hymenobacter nivis]|uniref:DUF1735 domain-containing protein n=1 Tax=Hymenobacter nivis TaxID=1850093 RepID=A0A502GVD1_9BACT|nr:hypothetical protein [Hymenobacter nivis]TPG65844.1 hypothetical protein EAH73_10650 [Hymenobacter nivis]
MRTLFYSLRLAGLLAVAAGAVSSCLNPPEYSLTPSIDNAELTSTRLGTGSARRDSMVIAVTYQDGNGDLGLSDADIAGPFASNPKNYFLQPQLYNTTSKQFVDFTTSTIALGQYNGRYPHITPEGTKEAPVKGTLLYSQNFLLGSPFRPGQEVRFVVSIQDRALNRSNVVTTNSIIIP